MPWTLIESAAEGDAVLELYGKNGMFMIRANGLELMNGFCHESEVLLGQLAAKVARASEPRVLIGGLGLGYTAAAVSGALGGRGSIVVAELSAAVIDWFHRHIKPAVLPVMPNNLVIAHTDIADALKAGQRHDVIVLDVDNGPEPLVAVKNGDLYSPAGLKALHACLAEKGVALLWSGFESAVFEASARSAGFAVRCEPFQRERAALSHYVYVLDKEAEI